MHSTSRSSVVPRVASAAQPRADRARLVVRAVREPALHASLPDDWEAQAQRLAIMAQDGFARAIRPVHTPFDGDVVFALSTGHRPLGDAAELTLTRLGSLAADCLARAIARGVFEASKG